MAFSRYKRDSSQRDGKGLSVAKATVAIRRSLNAGTLPITRTITTVQGERLDTIAGQVYGDGRYWWALAAASNIGWSLQVPPGTIINIVDLKAIEKLVG
jgi:nucleoid-associated protein YgaU